MQNYYIKLFGLILYYLEMVFLGLEPQDSLHETVVLIEVLCKRTLQLFNSKILLAMLTMKCLKSVGRKQNMFISFYTKQ